MQVKHDQLTNLRMFLHASDGGVVCVLAVALVYQFVQDKKSRLVLLLSRRLILHALFDSKLR